MARSAGRALSQILNRLRFANRSCARSGGGLVASQPSTQDPSLPCGTIGNTTATEDGGGESAN